MFANFAKTAETPYHFIDDHRFGSIIFHAVTGEDCKMHALRKKEMKDYVVDNDLDVNTMDIETFEEKILNVLFKREAKKAELNRTNPRNKNKSKNYNQNDQMKFGDQINASQYQNYDRSQRESRYNNYQGDYNYNKN